MEQNNVAENVTQVNSINPGTTGVFTFKPTGALSDKSINVYYHTPQGDLTNFPILFLTISWKNLTTNGAMYGGFIGLFSALLLVLLGPTVWVETLGFENAILL